jgi:phospholipase C/sugar lactone lactonase YvrE
MRHIHSVCLVQFLLFAFASANAQMQILNFGGINVGAAAPVQTLTYTFNIATTLSAVNILTLGVAGLDYTDGGSSTCTIGTAYNAGQSCVVTVAFTPSASGLRTGGVTLFAPGSSLPLATWYLSGIGLSSTVTIDPGVQSTIATLSNGGVGYGSVIDGAGDVYVVDDANSQVFEIVAGTLLRSTVLSSGLLNPTAAALDGAGNLYISDTGNSRVVMVPNEQGGLNSGDMSALNISGLGSPTGLATDGSGNLYVADATNAQLLEVPEGGGPPTTLISGLNAPQGVVVDGPGNVYVSSSNGVTEYPAGGGMPVSMGSGYNKAQGLAVDASGAIYVADTGNSRIVIVAHGGASQVTLAITGLSSPRGIALDKSDNAYVTDGGNVYEVNRMQAAALSFANTNVGSTSAPQILTVSDAGNQPLTVSNLVFTLNFEQLPSGGTDCSSSIQLSPGGQCLIAVALEPSASGTLAGSVSLTDNALNKPTSTETVLLSGVGLPGTQTIVFTQTAPSAAPYNGGFTVAATASSGLLVSFGSSGECTNTGATFTMTNSTGSCTVTASQSGNANYLAAVTVKEIVAAGKAAPVVTFTGAPASAAYLSTFTVTATSNSGIAPNITAAGPCSISGTTITMTSGTGACTLTASWPTNTYYLATSRTQRTTAAKIVQMVTFTGAPATAAYQSFFMVMATSNTGITPIITAAGGPCSIQGTTVTMTSGTGTCTLTASWPTNAYYSAASVIQKTMAEQQVSIVTWPPPAVITYGTPLSATQLNATANVAGTFVYTPATGRLLNAGNQTLSVTFTPTQNQDYTKVTASVGLQVNQAPSSVTWSTPAAITYGTPLSTKQLDATSKLVGTFAYSPNAGTVVNAGSQTLSVQFAPTNSNYASSSGSVTLQVNPAPQTIMFQPITSQTDGATVALNATASSGLPVSFAVTSGPATINGNVLTTTGNGSVTVQATQAGNFNYAPAIPVSQAFVSTTGKVAQFNHVVIIVQENRTPDNLFGSNPTFEPGVDIAGFGQTSTGATVPLLPAPLASCWDVRHNHTAFEQAYNGDGMNGFNLEGIFQTATCILPPGSPQYKYVDNSSGTVQPYFDIAQSYGWANRMFQTNEGPSFAAHQFIIGGTSAPTPDSAYFASEIPSIGGGCTAPSASLVALISPLGKEDSSTYPCLEHGTLTDLLDAAGLTWNYYSPTTSWNAPLAIRHICQPQVLNGVLECTGSDYVSDDIQQPPQVLTDIANCHLSNVAWVIPAEPYSDHAMGNNGTGPAWVASIVNAIGTSNCGYWQDTAILITWDDWGGWYDHVPPPKVITDGTSWGSGYVYGFRVPLLVVSAFTDPGYVSDSVHDFGSLLGFVEANFHLGLIGNGTYADAYADNLMEFFPEMTPRTFAPIQTSINAGQFRTEKMVEPDNDGDEE